MKRYVLFLLLLPGLLFGADVYRIGATGDTLSQAGPVRAIKIFSDSLMNINNCPLTDDVEWYKLTRLAVYDFIHDNPDLNPDYYGHTNFGLYTRFYGDSTGGDMWGNCNYMYAENVDDSDFGSVGGFYITTYNRGTANNIFGGLFYVHNRGDMDSLSDLGAEYTYMHNNAVKGLGVSVSDSAGCKTRNLIGFHSFVQPHGSVMNRAYGYESLIDCSQFTADADTLAGFISRFWRNPGSGKAAKNVYGFRYQKPAAYTRYTNVYGIYLDSVVGATGSAYSIYSAGGDAYFEDDVTADTVKASALQVTGNVTVGLGTANSPSLNNNDTGIFFPDTSSVSVSLDGVRYHTFKKYNYIIRGYSADDSMYVGYYGLYPSIIGTRGLFLGTATGESAYLSRTSFSPVSSDGSLDLGTPGFEWGNLYSKKTTASDSATVGSGGIWQRNWYYNAADSSVRIIFYNSTLSRIDTVKCPQAK